jgi:hypothetical protein
MFVVFPSKFSSKENGKMMHVPASTTSSSPTTRQKHGQLYHPKPGSMDGAIALLEKSNLKTSDIRAYLRRRKTNDDEPKRKQASVDEKRFMVRRRQIVDWASQVESGGAQIDINDRLVPNRGPEPLPQLPGPNDVVPGGAPGVGHLIHNHLAHPGIAGLLDNEDEERQWLEREEREAAEVIALAVKRYRDAGVPEEEFVLIHVPSLRRHGDTVNLTLRRICFAVLAVVTAFICIMLQTLPLFTSVTPSDPIFDKLMPELLHVRKFTHHARYCQGLHRNKDSFQNIFKGNASAIDCSDGVLHIPAVHVLQHEALRRSPSSEMGKVLKFYSNGVNVTWNMSCDTPRTNNDPNTTMVPIPSDPTTGCFRGVHDGWLTHKSVEDAIIMGAKIIQAGGDHFDIHEDTLILDHYAPDLISRVRDLLTDSDYYDNALRHGHLEPVAFRVQVALPMETAGVFDEKSSQYLGKTINRTNYIDWLASSKRHNAEVLYSLNAPPFPVVKPIRDTCNLMADMDASETFAVHTSIFLSHGAGVDYQGGALVYADSQNSGQGHKENARRRIRKGISVDGSRGRIVVSTGGNENRRCRLPTRKGIRAVLQIWWNYQGKEEESGGEVKTDVDEGNLVEAEDHNCSADTPNEL